MSWSRIAALIGAFAILGAVLLERLGALDAQQRHQEQREDGRAQAVEGRADADVGLARAVEDAAGDERRHREQHARARDAGACAEERHRVVQQAQAGEEAVDDAVRRICVASERALLELIGQLWVRDRRGLRLLGRR